MSLLPEQSAGEEFLLTGVLYPFFHITELILQFMRQQRIRPHIFRGTFIPANTQILHMRSHTQSRAQPISRSSGKDNIYLIKVKRLKHLLNVFVR